MWLSLLSPACCAHVLAYAQIRLGEQRLRAAASYLRTKASPPIMYLPAKQTEETQRVLDEQKQGLEQQIGELRERRAAVRAEAEKQLEEFARQREERRQHVGAGGEAAVAESESEDEQEGNDRAGRRVCSALWGGEPCC